MRRVIAINLYYLLLTFIKWPSCGLGHMLRISRSRNQHLEAKRSQPGCREPFYSPSEQEGRGRRCPAHEVPPGPPLGWHRRSPQVFEPLGRGEQRIWRSSRYSNALLEPADAQELARSSSPAAQPSPTRLLAAYEALLSNHTAFMPATSTVPTIIARELLCLPAPSLAEHATRHDFVLQRAAATAGHCCCL